MSLREDVEKIERKARKIETESIAMELLTEAKKINRRTFIMWLVTFIFMVVLIAYVIYLKCDEITTTSEISIEDVETIDSSTIKIGDDIWEKSR